jgi:hypothetical protein
MSYNQPSTHFPYFAGMQSFTTPMKPHRSDGGGIGVGSTPAAAFQQTHATPVSVLAFGATDIASPATAPLLNCARPSSLFLDPASCFRPPTEEPMPIEYPSLGLECINALKNFSPVAAFLQDSQVALPGFCGPTDVMAISTAPSSEKIAALPPSMMDQTRSPLEVLEHRRGLWTSRSRSTDPQPAQASLLAQQPGQPDSNGVHPTGISGNTHPGGPEAASLSIPLWTEAQSKTIQRLYNPIAPSPAAVVGTPPSPTVSTTMATRSRSLPTKQMNPLGNDSAEGKKSSAVKGSTTHLAQTSDQDAVRDGAEIAYHQLLQQIELHLINRILWKRKLLHSTFLNLHTAEPEGNPAQPSPQQAAPAPTADVDWEALRAVMNDLSPESRRAVFGA